MVRLLRICLPALAFAPGLFGWGCEGHQIVALIARAHLTPAASAAVDDLLRGAPIDASVTRFCKDRPDDPMADAATWAVDTKNQEKTSVWHYVDIPRYVGAVTSLAPWCPPIGPSVDGKNRPGCIVDALEYEAAILRDKSRPVADRAMALRYIIHFAGDIHQPLHDEDNDDQGGNCTALQFFGEDRLTNLHAVWDYKMIQRKLETDKLTQTAYAAALNTRFAAKYSALAGAKPDDFTAWSWETHALSGSVTYGNLEPGIPVAVPGSPVACDALKAKVQALHIVIGDAYMDKAMPVIEEQLATAGFRLALLLNDTFQ